MKIEKLTPEQEAYLLVFRSEYLAHGTNCSPADRPRAEAAFARAYAKIGKEPAPVVWVGSPMAAQLTFAVIERLQAALNSPTGAGESLAGQLGDQLGRQLWGQLRDQLRGQLRDQLWDQLAGQLGDQLGRQLGGQLWGQLGDQLGRQLGGQLRGQLRDQLGRQIWDQIAGQLGRQLRDQLWGQLWDQLRDQPIQYNGNYLWGQHDLYWIAHYLFAARIGAKYTAEQADRLDIMHEIGMSCMWWWPYEHLIIACERPSEIHFDESVRLHNEVGAAVKFRDGYSLYAWNGRRVPEHWIEERETLDPNEIISHENVEMRAIGCEIIGWPKMLSVLKAKTIDDSGSTDIGELIELNLPGLRQPGRFLKAECPRNGVICEGVPRNDDFNLPIKTALHAQAWRVGLHPSEYRHPEVRT